MIEIRGHRLRESWLFNSGKFVFRLKVTGGGWCTHRHRTIQGPRDAGGRWIGRLGGPG